MTESKEAVKLVRNYSEVGRGPKGKSVYMKTSHKDSNMKTEGKKPSGKEVDRKSKNKDLVFWNRRWLESKVVR